MFMKAAMTSIWTSMLDSFWSNNRWIL